MISVNNKIFYLLNKTLKTTYSKVYKVTTGEGSIYEELFSHGFRLFAFLGIVYSGKVTK